MIINPLSQNGIDGFGELLDMTRDEIIRALETRRPIGTDTGANYRQFQLMDPMITVRQK